MKNCLSTFVLSFNIKTAIDEELSKVYARYIEDDINIFFLTFTRNQNITMFCCVVKRCTSVFKFDINFSTILDEKFNNLYPT